MNSLLYAPSVRVKTFFSDKYSVDPVPATEETTLSPESISGSSRRTVYSVLFLYLFLFAPEIPVSGTKGLW